MQDYGGPVGFRMALAYPQRVQAMIIQFDRRVPPETATLVFGIHLPG
jgi:hypothetical protein